jgi:tryptophan-rich sensory protein
LLNAKMESLECVQTIDVVGMRLKTAGMMIKRPFLLCSVLLLVVGGGFLIGFATRPGAWYASLAKPAFTPPGWAFPLAWFILYVLIAIAGYRAILHETRRTIQIWCFQLALNFLWPIVFFGAQQVAMAFIVIMLLLAAILTFMSMASDGWARLLFAPYAAWVAFAVVLNGSILAAN